MREVLRKWAVTSLFLGALFLSSSAQAGIFSWLGKSVLEAAEAGTKVGVALGKGSLRYMPGPDVARLCSRLKQPIYIQAIEGQLSVELLEQGKIFSGSSDDFAKLINEASKLSPISKNCDLVLNRGCAIELKPQILDSIDGKDFYIVDPVLGPVKLVKMSASQGPEIFCELRKGIFTELHADFPAQVADLFNTPLKSEHLHVASLFSNSDVDSFKMLAEAAGDRMVNTESFLTWIQKGSLKKLRGKTVIVVGHVEDGAFVARNANGAQSFSVDMAGLQEMAARAEVTLVAAGCSSRTEGAAIGYVNTVTDRYVATSVKAALDAEDLGGMLGAFGKESPLIVSGDALAKFSTTRQLELKAALDASKPSLSPGIGVRVTRPFRPPPGDIGILGLFAFYYFLGFVMMVFKFRTHRSTFLRMCPVLPSPELPGFRRRYLFGWIGREALFLAVSPLIGAMIIILVIISFFTSGKGLTEGLCILVWSFVFSPIVGSRRLMRSMYRFIIYGVLALLLYALPVILFFTVGAAGSALLFGLSESAGGDTFFWLSTLLYWCACFWGLYRIIKRYASPLVDRLSRRLTPSRWLQPPIIQTT